MTHERWKAHWERIDKMVLTTPISWTCRHCAFPGEIRRAHEIPSHCPYCGGKVSEPDYAALEKQVEAQRAAVERDALAKWWREGNQFQLEAVVQ